MKDTRGVSMPLQYVLLVAIIALLAGALFVTMGGFVEDQREEAVEHGLEVVGTRVANDIVAADRLADSLNHSGDSGSLHLRVDTPETVAGSTYVMSVAPDPNDPERAVITLESTDLDVQVSVEVATSRTLTSSSVSGGRMEIRYDANAADPSLEVTNV